MNSKITKEACERCRKLSTAEQLEQIRQDMRKEFEAVHTDLRNVALRTHMNSERIKTLEDGS